MTRSPYKTRAYIVIGALLAMGLGLLWLLVMFAQALGTIGP